jgi:hypothetical protein
MSSAAEAPRSTGLGHYFPLDFQPEPSSSFNGPRAVPTPIFRSFGH